MKSMKTLFLAVLTIASLTLAAAAAYAWQAEAPWEITAAGPASAGSSSGEGRTVLAEAPWEITNEGTAAQARETGSCGDCVVADNGYEFAEAPWEIKAAPAAVCEDGRANAMLAGTCDHETGRKCGDCL